MDEGLGRGEDGGVVMREHRRHGDRRAGGDDMFVVVEGTVQSDALEAVRCACEP